MSWVRSDEEMRYIAMYKKKSRLEAYLSRWRTFNPMREKAAAEIVVVSPAMIIVGKCYRR